jgi:hypothetical protein
LRLFAISAGPSSSPSSHRHQPNYRPRYHNSPPSYENNRPNSFNQHEDSPPSRPNYNFNNNNNRGSSSPEKQHTQPSHNFVPPPNFFNDGPASQEGFENTQNLQHLMSNFDGKDRNGCQKVQKGDMSCYVCKDARGMNKEECMYASNDPKNQRMAYHEVTEYSSDPPASVLPDPRPQHQNNEGHHHGQGPLHQSGSSPVSSSVSQDKKHEISSSPSAAIPTSPESPKPKSVTRVESKIVSMQFHEENKSPVEYDFDY